ncbi:MAG: succinate dehydrogenase, cytochrome b556 subunit [SAR86 cluster bacterium]|nr:succinate dehydrogenase, cytochrome b556 subunit [SAR86 cluster bacterium]|tara:strand:- start:581 stop:970 length:390 start_codon:yes stop_codon:yes gene_type:complete
MKEEDNRPIYLNLIATDLPIIGVSSIVHRISGFALFCIFIISVWMFDRSLSSEEEFLGLVADLKNLLLLKVLFYLFLVGFLYHSLIGVKKVLSDFFGIGEELKSGTIIAWAYNLIFLLVTSFLFIKFFV